MTQSTVVAVLAVATVEAQLATAQPQTSFNGANTKWMSESELRTYNTDIVSRVKKHWFPPNGNQYAGVVRIVFKIHSQGELSDVSIQRSSGIRLFDSTALKAVEDAAPFRPLPAGHPESLGIQLAMPTFNVFDIIPKPPAPTARELEQDRLQTRHNHFEESLKQPRADAEQGDAEAQAGLGLLLCTRGSAKEQAEGLKWLNKAATQGNAEAEYRLGDLYWNGWVVPKDTNQAVAWWHKAAVHGDLRAQGALADRYFNWKSGDGYLCYVWASYAAQRGHQKATMIRDQLECYLTPNQLSELHTSLKQWDPTKPIPPRPSFDISTNLMEVQKGVTLHLLEKRFGKLNRPADPLSIAAEQGNPAAQMQLSFEYSRYPVCDNAEAMKWLRKAAENGNSRAMKELAAAYPAEKEAWMQKAHKQEQRDALSFLSALTFIDTGAATPRDPSGAVKYWTQRAEEKHDARSMYNLGLAYHKGVGVAANDAVSSMWLNLAYDTAPFDGPYGAALQIKTILSPDQNAESDRLMQDWKIKHPVRYDPAKQLLNLPTELRQ